MKFLSSLAMAATMVASACAQSSIPETLVARDDMSILVALLTNTGLVSALEDVGPFTVFAPTDTAFDRLPQGIVEFLTDPANSENLTDVLLYHVAAGEVMAASLADGSIESIETLQMENITVSLMDDNVTLNNDTMVSEADIMATNGIIHIIDGVLVPPSLMAAVQDLALNVEEIIKEEPMLSALAETITTAGLDGLLANESETFTVFAPNNDAFDNLTSFLEAEGIMPTTEELQAILGLHVVGEDIYFSDAVEDGLMLPSLLGGSLMFSVMDDGNITVTAGENNATIIMTDIVGSNGVIHIIDAVLLPPGNDTVVEDGFDVGDAISADDDLTTLASLLNSTGLLEFLGNNEGPLTIFAPTDDALTEYLEEVGNLTDLEVRGLLSYHVIPGENLTSTDIANITNATEFETLLPNFPLTIEVDDSGEAMIISGLNNASIVEADIFADNGVIHKIDNLLLPDTGSPTDAPGSSSPNMSPVDTPIDIPPVNEPSASPGESPTDPPATAPASAGSTTTAMTMTAMIAMGAIIAL